MKKFLLLILISFYLLISPDNLSAQQAEITPSPIPPGEVLINQSFPADKSEVRFTTTTSNQGVTTDLAFDLKEIPSNAKILDTDFVFTQSGTGRGLVKIIDKRTGSFIDSLPFSEEGIKKTSRVDSIIKSWVLTPENNMGITLQSDGLEENSNIVLNLFAINIEYITLDTISPTILKLDLKVINESSISIDWETNEPVATYVEYGKTSNYDKKTEPNIAYAAEGLIEIAGLSPNITYHLRFTASDSSGNKILSNNTTFTTNSVQTITPSIQHVGLLPPRILNFEIVSQGNAQQIDLAWTKSDSDDLDGYIVFRNTSDGEFSEITRIEKTVNRYSDTKVVGGTIYHYFVVSYRGNEQSSRSPLQTVTLPKQEGILGLESIVTSDNSGLGVFFILAGILIILGSGYLIKKRIRTNIAYNRSLTSQSRLHNYLHDPQYYINGNFEDSIIQDQDQ